MASWPSLLPQIALDDYQESTEAVTLRSSVDVGPPKLRPRYTAEITRFRFSLILSKAQVATLETFYSATVNYGSEPFDWIHQRTKAAASLRFVGRPTYSNAGGIYWRTELDLEVLP